METRVEIGKSSALCPVVSLCLTNRLLKLVAQKLAHGRIPVGGKHLGFLNQIPIKAQSDILFHSYTTLDLHTNYV